MLTQAAEKARINELLRLDEASSQTFTMYQQQALTEISDNLQRFYMQYADESGLSLAQTRQAVSRWDIAQWQRAIDQLDMTDWDDNAKYLAGEYAYQAGYDRTHLMGAMVGMSLISMTSKVQQHITDRVKTDAVDQEEHLKRLLDGPPIRPIVKSKPVSIITQDETTALWSDSLWLKSESMANDVQSLVNLHLRHGMSIDDLKGMLVQHVNPRQFRPGKSIADRISQMDYQAERILRTESARLVDEVNMTTYSMQGVIWVDWIDEPGACEMCAALADGGPYPLNDVPSIPGDTHPNCRCSKIPHTR
ncbi:hypothetical protein [Lactiplantibacillus daowaiensis]|uniref:Phage Mu protein F like protein n=1 Tax=Lactiplantibacillus daowaiensis TaxID=2559918 RepID=A0ABW1RY06_9LACO|nr:hypothetical protein [Lactiplantibacillus daowaiensis]